ncbi:major facilitator superfamily protein [Streptococcus ratti FA-1 = DSM 20564]|uniref:Uncharacterized protein n=1 Tax=Streptococcus ratti FA-1 = DSM 20564 TaxID=699248 RepID=A0ABP2R1A8_STRRT|nr:hypothetical protein SRA_00043 [Streptococcus ratti FA-1 = DSM 20564]EMP70506.1 major facilitator superfamily protein [Streptococcus ratti FA-1 = DSM 20564]QEY07046.1 hypothetical protein FY406_05015 [Streptococcus ratti]VEI59469.1 major facilitator superfamily protein [Streptococcus mutans]
MPEYLCIHLQSSYLMFVQIFWSNFTVVALSLLILIIVARQAGFAINIISLGICFGGVMGVFPFYREGKLRSS